MRRNVMALAALMSLGVLWPVQQADAQLRRGGRGGIPPRVAEKIGVPKDVQQKVQQFAFDANAQIIELEADLKRARLELDKLLAQDRPDQRAVMALIDKVSKAEAEVRKNRVGLMLEVREALGPELWRKLQAEMPKRGGKARPGRGGRGGPGGPGGAADSDD